MRMSKVSDLGAEGNMPKISDVQGRTFPLLTVGKFRKSREKQLMLNKAVKYDVLKPLKF